MQTKLSRIIIGLKQELSLLYKKYNPSENSLLLAWILQHPSAIIPVIGTTNSNRIYEANSATKITLETEDGFALLVVSQGHKVP